MITGINHITFAISDLPRSIAFYRDVLGCAEEAIWETGAYLSAGSLWLCLSLDPNASEQPRSDYTHTAFDTSAKSYPEIEQRILASDNVRIWKDNRSEGVSLYFLDPDGHKLELHVGNLESRLLATNSESVDA